MLADYIIGNKAEVAGGEATTARYYVRNPGEEEVYIAECKMDLSAKFSDWIEPELLKVTGDDITHLTIDDYSFDEQQRAAVGLREAARAEHAKPNLVREGAAGRRRGARDRTSNTTAPHAVTDGRDGGVD